MIDALAALVGIGICLVIGGSVASQGMERRRIADQFRRTAPTTTAAVSDAKDAVELRGRVEPHPDHEPLSAPFSDDECVYKRWTVTEKRHGALSDRKSWRTAGEGTDSVPFRLVDDHGAVGVETASFDTVLIDANKDPGLASWFGTPDEAKAFVAEHVGESRTDSGLFSRSRKFEQTLLKPGDDVYVFGKPQTTGDEFFDREVVTGFGDDSEHEGVISDYSPRRLRLQTITGWLRIGYGVAFAVSGTFAVFAFLFDHPLATTVLWAFALVVGIGVLLLLADAIRASARRFYYARLAA